VEGGFEKHWSFCFAQDVYDKNHIAIDFCHATMEFFFFTTPWCKGLLILNGSRKPFEIFLSILDGPKVLQTLKNVWLIYPNIPLFIWWREIFENTREGIMTKIRSA